MDGPLGGAGNCLSHYLLWRVLWEKHHGSTYSFEFDVAAVNFIVHEEVVAVAESEPVLSGELKLGVGRNGVSCGLDKFPLAN